MQKIPLDTASLESVVGTGDHQAPDDLARRQESQRAAAVAFWAHQTADPTLMDRWVQGSYLDPTSSYGFRAQVLISLLRDAVGLRVESLFRELEVEFFRFRHAFTASLYHLRQWERCFGDLEGTGPVLLGIQGLEPGLELPPFVMAALEQTMGAPAPPNAN